MRPRALFLWASILLTPMPLLSQEQQIPAPPPPPPSSQFVPEGMPVPGSGTPLTLQQAEAIALKNNPQITIGKLQYLVSRQNVRETRAALLPSAYLSVTGVGATTNARVLAGALNNPTVFDRAAVGVTVNQLITDFGRTTNLVSSSEFEAKAQDKWALANTSDIILAVDQTFFNAVETKALVTVAQETVRARQTFVDKIQALTNAKLKSDLDLSFASVDLARGKLLLLEAVNNYDAALNTLSAMLGYKDKQNFDPVEEINEATPPAPDVNTLVMQAMLQRPEIQALQDQVSGAEKFSNAEHDLKKPSISAIGVAGYAPARANQLLSDHYGAVGVNINIPIFNGFYFDARAKTADLQTNINRQKLSDTRNNIARDVRNAWQDSRRAFERLSVTQQLRQQANLALNLAQARYNLGLGSIVEFTQAELQKTAADIEDTDAKYQYRLTQIVLAFTMSAPK
ncbi:MAG TPA: TolC family protein [Verrucomicrobiae bacterium]|nr:TolC family protein [Verrucomicrobiae bacterium]